MSRLVWLLAIAIAGGGAVFGVLRCEGTAPEVHAADGIPVSRQGARVEVVASDAGSGLRRVEIALVHARGEATLLERDYPGTAFGGGAHRDAEALEVAIDPEALELRDGSAVLRVTATDWSLRHGLAGNAVTLEVPVTIDVRAPRVQVESGLTYVRRGGSAAVVYRVNEGTSRDGVEVGGHFFRGAPIHNGASDGRRVAVFAVPTDAPASPAIRVVAWDEVGNEGAATWPTRIRERTFPVSSVRLPEGFLSRKVEPLARANGIDASDPVAAFQTINTDLRAANEARVRELLGGPPGARRFEGPFVQLPGSLVTSRFAERRSYVVGDAEVSQATHYGYDLASTAGAAVTASNAGRVAFADELGIYGNCVLIDHGLGVGSLYGHLSQIDVEEGDEVGRGQVIGRTGETGLAGGDHLHFAILVGDTYVDPIEWWDAKWIREHLDERLEPAAP